MSFEVAVVVVIVFVIAAFAILFSSILAKCEDEARRMVKDERHFITGATPK